MNSLNQVEVEVKFLHTDIARVKKNFEQIIKDKDIDLNHRWRLFWDAPECLRESFSRVPYIIRNDPFWIELIHSNFDYGQEISTREFVSLVNDGSDAYLMEFFLSKNLGTFWYYPP